jgi:DNA-directed RNA polymerase specialized sigma24 family protein
VARAGDPPSLALLRGPGRGRLRPRLAQLCRTQPERTENLPGWLRVVALHEGFRLLRQAGREPLAEDACRQEREDGGGGVPVSVEELLEAPVDVELAVEAREALRALASLRWRRRRMLVLRTAGYRYKEMAELLGVTYTNVNRHVTEGRGELREIRQAAESAYRHVWRAPQPDRVVGSPAAFHTDVVNRIDSQRGL